MSVVICRIDAPARANMWVRAILNPVGHWVPHTRIYMFHINFQPQTSIAFIVKSLFHPVEFIQIDLSVDIPIFAFDPLLPLFLYQLTRCLVYICLSLFD